MMAFATITTTVAAITIPRACLPPHDTYPFCNASLPHRHRIDDLISRLTLDEKPTLLMARESPKGNVSRLGVPEYDWGANCVHGVQSRCSAEGRCPTSYPNPNTLGASFNKTVWQQMGSVIGLELRSLWLQGVGEAHDDNLPHLGLDCWSPNINIVRDPRWGRNLETPSEDPLVCGWFGERVTRGLQVGADPRFLQAVVTLKHFDANSLEGNWGAHGELNRHTFDAKISQHDLFASYLPAFKRAVVEGNAKGVMCSYNAINGVPSCANAWLLGDVLRKSWNFSGYVTSDTGAVIDMYKGECSTNSTTGKVHCDGGHHYTHNWTQTVTKALDAGCDIESHGEDGQVAGGLPPLFVAYAPAAVRSGELQESKIDDALRHALSIRFELGLFDPIDDQPYWHVRPEVVRSPAHLDLALDATRQGLVLLQNGGGDRRAPRRDATAAAAAAQQRVLPFVGGARTAVIGPHANDHDTILGNYIGQICPDGLGSRECVPSVYEEVAKLNRVAAAKRGVAAYTVNATGVDVNSTDASRVKAALAAAADVDVIIYVGGLDVKNVEREGLDRHEVGLPGLQPQLLRLLLQLNKPLALVLLHGGIVTIPSDILACPHLAVVSAGYPGIHGGRAIAEALFDAAVSAQAEGDEGGGSGSLGLAANRWGRLAVTWYSHEGWDAAQYDMLSFDMAQAPGRTYRYYTGKPQWPFGFGLSYAELVLAAKYSAKAGAAAGAEGGTGKVLVSVTNKEPTRTADAVVLLYMEPVPGTVPADVPAAALRRQLVAFERLGPIPPKSDASFAFELTAERVTLVDAVGAPVLYPGRYDLLASLGDGLSDIRLRFECDAQSGCRAV